MLLIPKISCLQEQHREMPKLWSRIKYFLYFWIRNEKNYILFQPIFQYWKVKNKNLELDKLSKHKSSTQILGPCIYQGLGFQGQGQGLGYQGQGLGYQGQDQAKDLEFKAKAKGLEDRSLRTGKDQDQGQGHITVK